MSAHGNDNTSGQNTPNLNANPQPNLGGVKPTAFQDVILNAKKRMVVNVMTTQNLFLLLYKNIFLS